MAQVRECMIAADRGNDQSHILQSSTSLLLCEVSNTNPRRLVKMIQQTVGPMSQLLAQIQSNTQKYLQYFSEQSLPEPSFEDGDSNAAFQIPSHVQAARDAALEATDELHHLLLGPFSLLVNCPGDQYLMMALQYIYRYKLAERVPVEDETSFETLATECGLDRKDVERFLRVGIARHVFHEPRKGYVKHTAASRLLIGNPLLESWILNIAEEFWPSVARVVDATAKWPGSEEPNESGYSLGHNTDGNPFDIIKKDPTRQQRFNNAMTFSHMHPSYSVDYLLDSYDFSNASTLVDVGGSHGQVSMAIAQKYPHVKCIVQDLPEVVSALRESVPQDLQERVVGMEHDFLSPQPVHDADVYLLRWILHDWSDKYCVRILRNLIPALKPGARVVVNDICIPEPGQLGIAADRALRLMDISLKAFNNARERDYETWTSLFKEADSRFEFVGVKIPPGARMAVIEAKWIG